MSGTKKLVTYALPYANGPLHLGHMLGMVQSDIYVRFLRQNKQSVVFVCGDDAHGTPIMLNAMKQKIAPEQLIADIYKDHKLDIDAFNINFDCYTSTHDDLNAEIVSYAYNKLVQENVIVTQSVSQAYDEQEQMFLPDRYVVGTCPFCGALDQHGDHCEVCGKTYSIDALKDPKSILSNKKPVWRDTNHAFYALSTQQSFVESWVETAHLQSSIRNKLGEWFEPGLQNWDITRDAPYFGIEIPGRDAQYFYVWMDAPFGYVTALAQHLGLSEPSKTFEAWNDHEVTHFIGKDIICFHGVFWPSVLNSVGLNPPKRIQVHGFLTLTSAKMSKSKGHYVAPKQYMAHLPADMLRYYLAARLSNTVADIDIDWNDFMVKVNSDLVGKLANMCSRSQGFIHKFNQGRLSDTIDQELINTVMQIQEQVELEYQQVNIASVTKHAMHACDLVNQYIDSHKPWQLAKQGEEEKAVYVASTALNAFI